MAKRDKRSKQTRRRQPRPPRTDEPDDAMEQRVVAFAEQLGRIVGTVQARTEGWMDRETLKKQIAGVRDSAAELLDQLADERHQHDRRPRRQAVTRRRKRPSKGRSGGVVDAPGKKHRKPMPIDPAPLAADARRVDHAVEQGVDEDDEDAAVGASVVVSRQSSLRSVGASDLDIAVVSGAVDADAPRVAADLAVLHERCP